jgi:hypothetical protein
MDDEKKGYRLTRRSFLVRTGILGAVAAVSPGLLMPRANAALSDSLTWSVDQLILALNELSKDTFKGLAAFIVPGNDPYSEAQQVPSGTPGSIAARADEYMIRALDAAIPLPQVQMLDILDALGSEFELTPMVVFEELNAAIGTTEKWLLENLDDTVDDYLANYPIGGSTLFALLLNLLATRVNPLAVNGLLLSPFARLTWDEKAKVFADLDAPDPTLVATLQKYLDEPLHSHVPGVLPLLGNGALNLGAIGTFSEWNVFDPATRTITERPIGWAMCNYQPDAPPPADGWDEFKGYYQNRRSVS